MNKLNKCLLLIAILFLVGSLKIFVYGQQVRNDSQVKQIDSAYKGQIFVKKEGWSIPSLRPSETTTFTQKVTLKGKQKIKINVIDYEISYKVVTDEPFASIKKDFGQNQYLTIREYKTKNRIFGYKIQATPVSINKNTGAYTSIGVLFFFTFYDEDGDGKFETLVLDETTSGTDSFSSPPHIPQWVLK